MSKRLALAMAAGLLCATGAARADEAILRANNQASLWVGGHHLNYHETDTNNTSGLVGPGGQLDSEHGTQAAFGGGLTRQGSLFGLKNIYTSLSLDYSHGNTDYQGYLVNNNTHTAVPYSSTTRNTTFDVNLKVGPAFALGAQSRVQVVPYITYGYHNWVRDLAQPYGDKETYSHQYLGIGLLGQYSFTPKLVGSADLSVARTINPRLTTGSTGDFSLGSKAQTSLSVGLDYAVTPRLHASASYRATEFKYGQSPVGVYFEPDSKTIEQRFLVGLGYAF